jgi:hypothetical protein
MFGDDQGFRSQATRKDASTGRAAWEWLIWSCGLVLCVLQVLVQIANGSLREFFFISDLLYIPALFEDVTRWSGNIADWRVPPSPYYFPDIPLYAAVRSLGLSIEWSQYVSGVGLLILCIWSGRRAIVTAAPGLKEASACIAALAAVGIGLLNGHTVNWFAQLTVISVHGGAVVGAFGVLALCFARRRFNLLLYGALAALAFAMGASDALYLASCAVPLLCLGVCELVPKLRALSLEQPGSNAHAKRFLCAGAAALLGVVASSAIHSQTTARYVQPRASHWADSLHRLASDLVGPAQDAFGLILVSSAVAVYAVTGRPKGLSSALRTLALWHLLSTVSTLAAMVLGGRYSDIGRMRYLIVPLASSGIILSVLLALALARAMQASDLVRPLLAVSMVAGFCVVSWHDIRVLRRGTYTANMRQQIRCIQDARGDQKDSVVLTGYWNAKPLMLLSGGELPALQMEEGLTEPRWWINSRGWYRGKHDFGVVITNELGRDEIAQTYGAPSKVKHCGALELYIYEGEGRASLSRSMSEKFQRFVEH